MRMPRCSFPERLSTNIKYIYIYVTMEHNGSTGSVFLANLPFTRKTNLMHS